MYLTALIMMTMLNTYKVYKKFLKNLPSLRLNLLS